jgi:hypothetical protein
MIRQQRARNAGSAGQADLPAARPAGEFLSRFASLAVSSELVWLVVALGAVLRIRQYFANRSLWLDESFLAVNVIEHPFEKLFGPLQFNQAAPAGFLAVEKIATEVLGKSEYALRAFPLMCGLASLPLFALLTRRLLVPAAAPFALLLFALSSAHIYYSSEVKPYAADVVATLCLYLFALAWLSGNRSRGLAVLAGIIGAVLIQVSYVGIFVAAGIGAVLFFEQVWRRAWREMRTLALTGVPWALSAALFLFLYGRNLTHYTFEGDVFAKLPTSPEDLAWWATPIKGLASLAGVYHTTHNAAALIVILAGFLVIVGIYRLLVGRPLTFLILAAPILPMLIASALHKYPLLPRTLLFLLPLTLVLLAHGSVVAVRLFQGNRRLALAALGLALVGYQCVSAVEHFAHPSSYENIKWELRYVGQHWMPGDTLYLHYPTQFAFTYYLECGCFQMPKTSSGSVLWSMSRAPAAPPTVQMPRALLPHTSNVLVGTFAGKYHEGIYRRDAERLSARKRAWLLFTFVVSKEEREFISRDLLSRLDQQGRRRLLLHHPSADVYLYAFPSR